MRQIALDGTGEGGYAPRQSPLPSSAIGVGALIFTELMFFAGLISAYFVVRSGSVVWPPPGQPRLPVEATAANTFVLLASAWALRRAVVSVKREGPSSERATSQLGGALGLGAFFVAFQGFEWTRLLGFGLSVSSSVYGSFFYLIIGAHALHAVAGLLALYGALRKLRRGTLEPARLLGPTLFWYFVVGLWPILYILVYLL